MVQQLTLLLQKLLLSWSAEKFMLIWELSGRAQPIILLPPCLTVGMRRSCRWNFRKILVWSFKPSISTLTQTSREHHNNSLLVSWEASSAGIFGAFSGFSIWTVKQDLSASSESSSLEGFIPGCKWTTPSEGMCCITVTDGVKLPSSSSELHQSELALTSQPFLTPAPQIQSIMGKV